MNGFNPVDAKKRMIETLIKGYGIKDQAVIKAFSEVDRHLFVDRHNTPFAYEDAPLDIGYDQTISQPFMVAYMMEKLELNSDDTVLEIGTGSGYATALIASMVKYVTTIERIEPLLERAKRLVKPLYPNVHFHIGNGCEGFNDYAPYDKIIVSAATRHIPEKLIHQLKCNGLMIIPLGNHFFQDLTLIKKTSLGIKKTSLGGCRFVPLIDD